MAIDDRLEKIAERLERVAEAGLLRPAEPPEYDDRPLLTPKAAAQRLGISERTLRDLIRDGKIGSVKVAGARRLEQRVLDEYIAVRRVE